MCRLFGMSGGRERVRATFWLLEAPDSLARQSRREPDGTGLGYFDTGGHPVVEKQPVAAYQDEAFAREAREIESSTFLAHIRYASNGAVALQNTHPFVQEERLFAHNGVIGALDELERELGPAMTLVRGDTDSERFFALITRRIEQHGEIGTGIADAARWVAAHLPVFAINLILITREELWALRYPDTHGLYVLERSPGGGRGHRHLDHASAGGSVRVRSGDLAERPAVVVASEPMDEDPGWRELEPGELVCVDAALHVHRQIVIDGPPAHPLTLADLDPRAAQSQSGAAQAA
jgi:glutamine amidotransferase